MVSTSSRTQIHDWLFSHALPFWASAGVDKHGGGFYEALSLTGKPLPARPRRVRVQARQIYVFSRAALLGWQPQRASKIARQGFLYLTTTAWQESHGGFAHLLASNGDILDAQSDTYDHAFILFALCWYYRATKDGAAFLWIDRVLDFMNARLTHSVHGGFYETWPPKNSQPPEQSPEQPHGQLHGQPHEQSCEQPRRQNPHMHWLEALLALQEIRPDYQGTVKKIEHLVDLFQRYFFDANSLVLAEYYTEDWKPLNQGDHGLIEPGHYLEWITLLHRAANFVDVAFKPLAEKLWQGVMRYGGYDACGFVVDKAGIHATPAQEPKTWRLWPQMELLKAVSLCPWLFAAPPFTAPSCESLPCLKVHSIVKRVFTSYLAIKPSGLWVDKLDALGKALAVDVPASSLYHIMEAFAPLLEVSPNPANPTPRPPVRLQPS